MRNHCKNHVYSLKNKSDTSLKKEKCPIIIYPRNQEYSESPCSALAIPTATSVALIALCT